MCIVSGLDLIHLFLKFVRDDVLKTPLDYFTTNATSKRHRNDDDYSQHYQSSSKHSRRPSRAPRVFHPFEYIFDAETIEEYFSDKYFKIAELSLNTNFTFPFLLSTRTGTCPNLFTRKKGSDLCSRL